MKLIKKISLIVIKKGPVRLIMKRLFTPNLQNRQKKAPMKLNELMFKCQKQKICSKIDQVNQKIDQLNQILFQSRYQLQQHLKISNTQSKFLSQNIQKIISGLNRLKNIVLNEHSQKFTFQNIHFLLNHFNQYFQQNLQVKNNQELAIKIVKFQYQFMPIVQLIMVSTISTQNVSMSYFQKSDQLMKNTKIEYLGGQKQMMLSQQALSKLTNVAAAAILQEQQCKSVILKNIVFGTAFSKYSFAYNQALLKTMGFYRNPDVRIVSNIWNSPQKGALKHLSTITFQYIMYNKMIWIPVSRNQKKQNIFQQGINKIPVRILSNQNLQISQNRSLCQASKKIVKSVLIHIHGGGFLAMSSHSMQIFTRKWANQLQIPVICIDYRMPPEFPFPTPLQDCYRAYQFIVEQLSEYMNISVQNIILAGDSAGGNLSCALIGMIIKSGIKIPNGLFLAYPSTDLTMRFSQSYLNAFKDPLMKPSLLLLCLKQYLAYDVNKGMNPLASPILLTQSFVRGKSGNQNDGRFPLDWPETIIYVGGKDPLLDDSLKLASKLSKNNTPFHIKIYKYFSHGFFNLSFLIPECDSIIQQSCKDIKQTFLKDRKIK